MPNVFGAFCCRLRIFDGIQGNVIHGYGQSISTLHHNWLLLKSKFSIVSNLLLVNIRVKLIALIFCTYEFPSLNIIPEANWPYSLFTMIVPKITRPYLFPSTCFQFVIHGASYFATVASLQLYPDICTYTITLHKGRYCSVNLMCRILLGKRVIFVEVCTDPVACAQVLKKKVFYLAGCVSICIMLECGQSV